MDKAAIKNFSIWARNKLIADITYKAGLLGITEDGIKDALPQSTPGAEFYDIGTKEPSAVRGEEIRQRKELACAVRKKALQLEYKEAYRNVIEEVAYTWFNRLIAIRFMEVNDYMPSHIRVLSSEIGTKAEPDLVTTPFDAGLDFTQEETENIIQMKNDNQVDALFRFLFIRQCNVLNIYLPKLFEKTSDYTEILLNVSVTDQDGIVYHLTHDIKEEDFNISKVGEDGKPTGQVEIIGWLYQYYNTEPKDEAFALLKKNVKITKERIPAATQLFTPDWIVRYMVENSIGRLWLEGHEDMSLKKEWIYYLDEAEQEADVERQLKSIREEYKLIKPEDIKVIDPCMGSGHILVYAFDVLMQIYESYGYGQRDAAKSIVENNIYGLDIDDRAFQLAYFAVMMKARSYNRRFLSLGIEPNLCAIQESNDLPNDQTIEDCLLDGEHRETLRYLLDTFVDAREYGSILNVEERDYDGFLQAWEQIEDAVSDDVVKLLWYRECSQIVPVLAKQAGILARKYDVVVTNPPYMGISNGNESLNEVVKRDYPDSKSDMFAVFIERCGKMIGENGYQAMITQHAWMFLSSFQRLRIKLQMTDIVNMAHLGARAFEEIGGEVVQTTSFVMRKSHIAEYKGTYCRLIEPTTQKGKEEMFLAGENRYAAVQADFTKIPGEPVAYWVSKSVFILFDQNRLFEDYGEMKVGISTADNNRFVRLWHEINVEKMQFPAAQPLNNSSKKWFPFNNGGKTRRWYGNNFELVNWEDEGAEIASTGRASVRNKKYYLKKGATWTDISTGKIGVRFFDYGFLFSTVGLCLFSPDHCKYLVALLNSRISANILNILCPTLHFNIGDIAKMPVIVKYEDEVNQLACKCECEARKDWDSFETSWDFQTHPFLSIKRKSILSDPSPLTRISDNYGLWKAYTDIAFEKLKHNEEELNRIFIDIYGLQDELSPEVEDSEVTVRKADLRRDVRSFISYAVGCMCGRYSLYKDGIVYAGGEWSLDNFKDYASGYYDNGEDPKILYSNSWFMPDEDNIIPICDEEYLEDDIVSRLARFVEMIYGAETLEENLDFIAKALGNKGNTAREVIRNYFLTDFFKDHSRIYQKRPIYWLFDSGRQNGFKALIYMHRYDADTIGNLRIDYLHRMERIYESEIERMQDTIDNSGNAREVTSASKRKEKLQKQLKECQEYDEKIAHLALSRIEIDLDDGVKVNYEKVQTARDGKKYQVLAKI